MKSWIMTLWLANHDQSEWPDLSICQTEDACHVTDTKKHPSKDVIEKMCTDEFFAKHKYKYVKITSDTVGDEENDYDYSCCPKAGNSEANEISYQVAYSSHMSGEGDHKRLAMNQAPKEPDDNGTGYLCPVGMEAGQHSDTERSSSSPNTTEVAGCKRSRIEICQDEAVSRTANEASYPKETKIRKSVVEYSNSAFILDQDEDSSDENAESISNYDTPGVPYQVTYMSLQGHSSQDEDTGFIAKYEKCHEEYQNICMICAFNGDDVSAKENTLACSCQNAAYFTCSSPTGAKQSGSDQLVPQSDHLYVNVEKTTEVRTQDAMSQETGQSHIEADCQEKEALPQPDHDIPGSNGDGVPKHNSLLRSWLNDPQLEVIYYI